MGVGALAVHGAKAHTRLGSTAISLGHADPILSILEDAVALALVVAAVLLPLLALAVVILAVVAFRIAPGSTARY
jgi:hypothetical protein